MNQSSFGLLSNYFDQLRQKAQKIDEGINRLTETWKTPHLLIGGYEECTAETSTNVEEIWDSIRSTNDLVEECHSEITSSLQAANQHLEDTYMIYENLKEQSNDIDTVLAEYGYHYKESNENLEENQYRDDNKYDMNNSILTTEEMPNEKLELTPDLWNSKSKEFDGSILNKKNPVIKSIATPVIKSLASIQSEKFGVSTSYTPNSNHFTHLQRY